VTKWQEQQEKLAQLKAMVIELQAGMAEASVSRSTFSGAADVPDLSVQADTPEELTEVTEVLTVQPAALETADVLRQIGTVVEPQAEAVVANPALDPARIAEASRLETLAVIEAGVAELVAAVVAGNYEIHTNYADEDFSGRIHFEFAGENGDQKELERFLATAAEAGIVAHSTSVVGSDGKVNGHILLFDLVERALENGTAEERAASERMRNEAVALLAADVTVGEPANAAGERYYVVEPGDSLAYIALQFYGNTNDFHRIFEANTEILKTPDMIEIGQRLLIPA
jgi:nucleoid-associated protein YgaU